MEIIAYTLPGCSSCKHLKELFKRANVNYQEVVLSENMSIEDFQQTYPAVNRFPYVVADGSPVGGLLETVKLFVNEGLVTSKKQSE